MCERPVKIGCGYDGGLAEYMLVPARAVRAGCVLKIPDGVTLEQAALAHPLATCLSAQESARVGLGKTVLILGAGPLGCLNALVAEFSGALSVFLADDRPERLDTARGVCAGAHMIDLAVADLAREIAALTERRGADVVLVTRPDADLKGRVLDVVAPGGVVDYFRGLPRDSAEIRVDVNALRAKRCAIVGSSGAAPRHHELALEVLATQRLDLGALTAATYPLDRAIEAVEAAEKAQVFKAIVTP
jgi:L-iditol 2-dehydrogenase